MRGTIPEKDLSDKNFIQWGNFLEAPIRANVKRLHPAWVIVNPGRYTVHSHPHHTSIPCTLERLIATTARLASTAEIEAGSVQETAT